jgi:death on curing protein
MAASIHYLTVQDVLWINLQATKKVHHFNYAKLEEATYYQYAYGESNTILPQAARFVRGFLKLHPLEQGNRATGFIGLISFLRLNGRCVNLADEKATSWFGSFGESQAKSISALESVVYSYGGGHHDHPDVRTCIQSTLNDFPETIKTLVTEP